MLIRFSLEIDSIEIFSYDTEKPSDKKFDPQLKVEFFNTIGETVLSNEVIYKLNFFNFTLYAKNYEKFTIRMLVDETVSDSDLNSFFEEIEEKIMSLGLNSSKDFSLKEKKLFEGHVKSILSPIINDPIQLITETLFPFVKQEITPKIALIGLSNAGKSTIKYQFFENWSKSLLDKIKPTTGVDYYSQFQEFLLHKFVVLDVGGQSSYQKIYLEQEDLWSNISAVIFIVDLQDRDKFEQAKEYFTAVWKVVTKVNKKTPKFSLFLHKFDPNKRNSLGSEVSLCLDIFKDFIDICTFYITTFYDTSSNIALIKSFYLSLPQIVLMRLLENDFLTHFEDNILPQFSLIASRLKLDNYKAFMEEIEPEIQNSAVILGVAYGSRFQAIWLDHLMGKKTIKPRDPSLGSIVIEYEDETMFISVKDWSKHGFPEMLTNLILEGMLEGILRTMDLNPPQRIEKNNRVMWKVVFNQYDNI